MKKQLLLVSFALGVGISAHAQLWDVSEPQKLKGEVNTEADESMPVFSKDSSILYFTRLLDPANKGGQYDQDIWMSVKDGEGSYVKCERVTSLNNKYKNSVFGISGDGKTIYVVDAYEGKRDKVKGCAQAKKKGKDWADPKHIDIPTLDIEGDFYGFHVNEAENIMVISYQGPNAIGQEDLYVTKKSGEEWSAPIHLGAVVNSAGYEISPFLSKNSDTLYYSSNGLGGLGDADIFFSVRLDDSWTNWSAPKNLGEKINSPMFDAYFSMSGTQILWVSNRGETGKDDIYFARKIPIHPPKCDGIVTNPSVYKGTDGKIDVTITEGVAPFAYRWSTGIETEDIEGLEKGDYTLVVTDNAGQKVECPFNLTEPPLKEGDDVAVLLTPPVVIYFDLGSWAIRQDAAAELDRIVAFMNEHPNVVIELGSHTDCRSSAEFNMRLSQNRAASSAMYIKSRIKNPTRIYGKGYGESKLKTNCPCEGSVLPNCSEEDHQKNRRTEFLVKFNDPTKIPKTDNVTPKIVDYKKNPRLKNQVESNGSTFVPAPMTELTAQQKKNIENGFYIVQKGETLFRVHKHTGVSIEDLKRLNNMTGVEVRVGQKILLK